MFIEFAGRIVNPDRIIAFDKNERHEMEGRFRVYCCFENTEIYEEFTTRAARDERFVELKRMLLDNIPPIERKPYFMVEEDEQKPECDHSYHYERRGNRMVQVCKHCKETL